MQGPGGAFVLVALQLLVGTFVFMSAAFIRWKVVNRGYYRSTTWVLWPLIAAVSWILPGQLRGLGLGVAILLLLFLGAVYTQRPLLEWITATAACLTGLALISLAGLDICATACWWGAGQALVGMGLMGAVTHAMVMGHWYLNQARLPIEPLREQTLLMFAAIAASAVAGFLTRERLLEGMVPGGIFTFAPASYWWTWVLMLAGTTALGAMISTTVKQRSTQSATGLLYIAIVTALGGQFVLNLLAAT